MKNSQSGFIFPLLVVIVLLVIGSGVYIYKNKKVEAPAIKNTATQPVDTKASPYVKYGPEDYLNFDLVKERLYEYFPKEMADFLNSYALCKHWSGEDAYNEGRVKDISQGIKSSCIDFKVAEQTIEKKFSTDPKLQEMKTTKKEINDNINSLKYSFIWNDPKKESAVLNKYTEITAQHILQTVKEQTQEYDDLIKSGADAKKIKDSFIQYRLSVQKSYLEGILPEIDRLHPITRKEIEALKGNMIFLQRASGIQE